MTTKQPSINEATQLRRTLLVNGYSPLPLVSREKKCLLKAWSTVKITESEIATWKTRLPNSTNTGLRCDNLLVVDIDLDTPEHARMARKLVETHLGASRCVRYRENSPRVTLLYAFTGKVTVKVSQWTNGEKRQGVELLFGSRQTAAFGIHPSGAVLKWEGDQSPAVVSWESLTEVQESAVEAFCQRLDLFMDAHAHAWGLKKVGEAELGGGYKICRDLTLDTEVTMFVGDEEHLFTIRDLLSTMDPGETGRGSVVGLRPETDGGTAQIVAGGDGGIIVSDHARASSHMLPTSEVERYWRERQDELAAGLEGLTPVVELWQGVKTRRAERYRVERTRAVVYERPPREPPADGHWPAESPLADPGAFEAVQPRVVPTGGVSDDDYLDDLVYVMSEDRCYHRVPVEGASVMDLKGLRALYGGDVVKQWLQSIPAEQKAHAVWCRPDRPGLAVSVGPDGRRYFNTYYMPPATLDREMLLSADMQDLDVSLAPFFRWVERVVPDDESRELFYDIVAHKLQDPMRRPLSVIMVAEQEGVGRDILFSLIAKVFGRQYCHEWSFERLNTRFNAELETASWVHIPEIADASNADRTYRNALRRVHETLKEMFSPGDAWMRVEGKGTNARQAQVHFTGFITTNYLGAVPVGKDSRRFLCIYNGRKPTKEEIEEIVAWRANPMNIVALRVWLRERNIQGDVFMAPQISAHKALIERAAETYASAVRSEHDEAVHAFLAECPTDVFTLEQARRWMALHKSTYEWSFEPDADAGKIRYLMLRASADGVKLRRRSGAQVRIRHKRLGFGQNVQVTTEEAKDQLDALDAYLDGVAHEQDQILGSTIEDIQRLSKRDT